MQNLQTEFDFYSKVVEKYEYDFENLKRQKLKSEENPSETLTKIVKLLQHKTQRASLVFNDMFVICQKEINEQTESQHENEFVYAQILEEFSEYFNIVSQKASALKDRIREIKKKLFGENYSRKGREQEGSKRTRDRVYVEQRDPRRNRGIHTIEAVLSKYGLN